MLHLKKKEKKNSCNCMKERLLQLKEMKFQLCKLKRWRVIKKKNLTRALRTSCVTQRDM